MCTVVGIVSVCTVLEMMTTTVNLYSAHNIHGKGHNHGTYWDSLFAK